MGEMIDRTHKELTEEEIAEIARTYHAWRGEEKDGEYEDIAGFCKAATLEEIKKHDYVLTPGRYVGIPEEEDDGIPFEDKMAGLVESFQQQKVKSKHLDEQIEIALQNLGF
jgi:type I restriction enzyme M protein